MRDEKALSIPIIVNRTSNQPDDDTPSLTQQRRLLRVQDKLSWHFVCAVNCVMSDLFQLHPSRIWLRLRVTRSPRIMLPSTPQHHTENLKKGSLEVHESLAHESHLIVDASRWWMWIKLPHCSRKTAIKTRWSALLPFVRSHFFGRFLLHKKSIWMMDQQKINVENSFFNFISMCPS